MNVSEWKTKLVSKSRQVCVSSFTTPKNQPLRFVSEFHNDTFGPVYCDCRHCDSKDGGG